MKIQYGILGFFFTLLLCCSPQNGKTQNVIISKDIAIRNENLYEILPNLHNKILLYRDRGREFFFDIFDNNLEYQRTAELAFAERRVFINKVVSLDSSVQIYFTFFAEDTLYLAKQVYDTNINLLGVDTILKIKEERVDPEFRHAVSEDEKKLALFQIIKNKLYVIVVDLEAEKGEEIILSNRIDIEKIGDREDFRGFVVSNSGLPIILFVKEGGLFGGNKQDFNIIVPTEKGSYATIYVDGSGMYTNFIKLAFDNINKRLAIAGLFGTKNDSEAEGIFVYNRPINQLTLIDNFEKIKFPRKVIDDLYGRQRNNKLIVRDHQIEHLSFRSDGGLLIVTEMNKKFVRSRGGAVPIIGSPGFVNNGFSRNLVDYYNEDLLSFSINTNNTIDWHQALFKKQFSQDDEGVFSSFGLFITPNRMQIVFNDEIKNNNTVSAYALNPSGNYERTSILNTDYQDLKLRLKDAVQISTDELIVPSERNYKLALVKVKM